MIVNFNLHPGQRDIIAQRRRFNHIRVGRQFGKSTTGYALVAETALRGQPAAYITPTATDYAARWDECSRALAPIITERLVSKGIMYVRGGGSIRFHGLHRAKAIRGNHYKRVVVDEAAHAADLYEHVTQIIMPTLMILDGDLFLMSTPAGVDFEKIEKINKDSNEWRFIHKPSSENPAVTASQLAMLRANMSSLSYRQEILAEYVDLEGARIKREWIRYTTMAVDVNYTYHAGLDPAISEEETANYSAIAVVAVPPRESSLPRIVVDVQRTRIAQLARVTEWVASIVERWGCETLRTEQVTFSQYLSSSLMQRLPMVHHTIAKPTKSKLTRFLPLEGQIEHGYLQFSPTVQSEFINELLSFTGEQKEYDDMVDALVLSEHSATRESMGVFVV